MLFKLALLLSLVFNLGAQTFTATVEGPPSDGDTIPVTVKTSAVRDLKPGVYRLRLFGADAPELAQEGGEESRRALARLAPHGTELRCEFREWSYGRPVATCLAGRTGTDMSWHQVRFGHALVWTPARGDEKKVGGNWPAWEMKPPGRFASQKTVKRAYVIEMLLIAETHAKNEKAGVWAGLKPWEKPCPAWRYRDKLCGATRPTAQPVGALSGGLAGWAIAPFAPGPLIYVDEPGMKNLPLRTEPRPEAAWEFHCDGTVKRLGKPIEILEHIGGGRLRRCDFGKILTSDPPVTECSIGRYDDKGQWRHEETVYR